MALITAGVEWISGHLRYAHYELSLEEEDLEEFKLAPKEVQKEWIKEEGSLIVDEYRVNDFGEITEIEVNE